MLKIKKAKKSNTYIDNLKDITGIILHPGNGGQECLGNGFQHDRYGKIIECCCDECDFYLICFPNQNMNDLY